MKKKMDLINLYDQFNTESLSSQIAFCKQVDKLLQMHFSRKKDYGRALWCILMFQMWHEMFIEKNNYHIYIP